MIFKNQSNSKGYKIQMVNSPSSPLKSPVPYLKQYQTLQSLISPFRNCLQMYNGLNCTHCSGFFLFFKATSWLSLNVYTFQLVCPFTWPHTIPFYKYFLVIVRSSLLISIEVVSMVFCHNK